MKRLHLFFLFATFLFSAFIAEAQEHVGHTRYNPFLAHEASKNPRTGRKTLLDTIPLSLPFFDDFTGYSVFPDSTKWVDYEAYVNNTMCVSPISRGVATLDGLNALGIPYDSVDNLDFRYCDSLTSQPINLDLGTVGPGDSVYLSFFYQPQGNAYYPINGDSLMLFFKTKYGGWVLEWSIDGSDSVQPVPPFTQIMIPINDSIYYDSFFQFRFINKGAMDYADADWNIDYVRLNKGRSAGDTGISDVAFSSDPSYFLNDYTSMPYRQFMANPASETSTQYWDSIHNNYPVSQLLTFGYSAIALNTGAVLQPAVTSLTTVFPYQIDPVLFIPNYTTTIPIPGIDEKVIFENTYFFDSLPNEPHTNDTIVKDYIFDNYLAYDDGSAEKSYYLELFSTLPGKIAIEFHLNQPDTLRGIEIYFGRQLPFSGYKTFSMEVYSSLGGVNGASVDGLIYDQDLYNPAYADTMNHFWVYTFDTTIVMPAGIFYAGITQPAEGNSDSLYIGLDVNRVGPNHVYYNVLNSWSASLISGALMIRPLFGQVVIPMGVTNIQEVKNNWSVKPNPAKDEIQFQLGMDGKQGYRLTDMSGHSIMEGLIINGEKIDISNLASGMYLVSLISDGISSAPKKLIKL